MKFIFKIIGGVLFLLSISGAYLSFIGTSDLRKKVVVEEDSFDKAKALLEEMAKAHGSEAWKGMETYRLEIEDEFFPPMGDFSHPFDADSVHLMLYYIPNTFTGQMAFLSSRRMGRIWGIQGWKPYWINNNHRVKFTESENILFWLPTYQYFFEFPFRIQKADALAYAGEQMIDDRLCDGVLASWKTLKPQKDIDQYLVWIDREDKRIRKLEYTIRDAYNFLTGAIYYKGYQYFEDDILLPTRLPVESNLVEEGLLHQITLHDFERNYISKEDLMPDPNIEIKGDDKSN